MTNPNSIAAAAAAVLGPGCATRPVRIARKNVCRLPPIISHCLRPIFSRNGIEAQLTRASTVVRAPDRPDAVSAARPI